MQTIVTCGIPRSGSTLVWQIMREALPRTRVLHVHPGSWQFKSKLRMIGSMRNPYDVVASLYRVRLSRGGENIEGPEGLIAECGWARKNYHDAGQIFRSKGLRTSRPLLRYEDFLHDYDVIYRAISSVAGVNVPPHRRHKINAKFSLDANRKRAARLANFNERDAHDIHGDHIGTVEPGLWKQTIPEWGHEIMHEWCAPIAKEWGYA
jgi:hypothetical protein